MSNYLVDVERAVKDGEKATWKTVGIKVDAARAVVTPEGSLLFWTDEELVAAFGSGQWQMFSKQSQ